MAKDIGEIAKKYRQSHRGVMTKRYLEMKAEAKKWKSKTIDRRYFNVWCMELSGFRELFYAWYEGGYRRESSPVIEKINKTKGFAADNLRWVTQKEKNRSNGKSMKVLDGDKWMEFGSARKAELEFDLPKGVLSRALRTNGRYKDLRVYKNFMKKEVIKFELNKPVFVRFSFSKPFPARGKYGMQYYYAVKKGNKDYALYATENLNALLQSTGRLFGRDIEIEKRVNMKGMYFWVLKENGIDITPF